MFFSSNKKRLNIKFKLLNAVTCAKKDIEHAEELAHSEKMNDMIQNARNIYDYVIIDSSPARYLNDPAVMNEMVDASLLVIKQDNATAQVINETIARITNVKNNLIGCIYNASIYDIVKQQKVYGYRYGYYRYHRKEREERSLKMQKLVDGKGAGRIAELLK